jgi:hypothetical protein
LIEGGFFTIFRFVEDWGIVDAGTIQDLLKAWIGLGRLLRQAAKATFGRGGTPR